MKQKVERYISFEIVIIIVLLHLGALLIADYYQQRHQLNLSYVYTMASCLIMITIFWMHEFFGNKLKKNVFYI